ncbi:COL10A [Mytilus coruscus]|uniref:COL10A n=1 Tax=Mytilus coruscus TaxID=42192 RepID=A0A6J8CHD4_MYTCO|nr:COL10A [Mytilus coruscus]
MMMRRLLFFALLIMRTVSSSIGSESGSLLTCSKFHFEEKVLEKLVRLEHKVEIYEETMKRWENIFVSKLEKLDEVQRQSETYFKSMQAAQVQEEIRLNKSYSEIFNSFKSQMNNETEFYEDQMNNLFESVSLKIQNKFQSFEEKTRFLTNNQNELNRKLFKNISINVTNSFQNMESKQNATNVEVLNTLSEIKTTESKCAEARVKIMTLEGRFAEEGVKIKTLERQVADNNRKVAITACDDSGRYYNGAVKFSTVYTQVGINNIAAFKSNGKFVCEIPGLYYISAHIRTSTTNTAFYVYKNNKQISRSASGSGTYTDVPISAVVDLQTNDQLYVRVSHNVGIHDSCVTIAKIK